MPTNLEIAEAICRINGELHRLVDLGLDRRRIDRIRREAIFFLYEGGEYKKWEENRAHSAEARKLRRTAKLRFTNRNFPITYDHAIPLATLWQGLQQCCGDAVKLNAFLEMHIAGVVVTKSEDIKLNQSGLRSSMPPGALAHDKLARYRKVGIAFEPDDEAKLTTKISN